MEPLTGCWDAQPRADIRIYTGTAWQPSSGRRGEGQGDSEKKRKCETELGRGPHGEAAEDAGVGDRHPTPMKYNACKKRARNTRVWRWHS
eukprot:6187419-Pleurochrysis_carterae.AAC.1